MNIIGIIVLFYIAICCGLYFKAELLSGITPSKVSAFSAPILMTSLLLFNLFGKGEKKLAWAILTDLYGSLLICFLSLSIHMQEFGLKPLRRKKTRSNMAHTFKDTNELISKKLITA